MSSKITSEFADTSTKILDTNRLSKQKTWKKTIKIFFMKSPYCVLLITFSITSRKDQNKQAGHLLGINISA